MRNNWLKKTISLIFCLLFFLVLYSPSVLALGLGDAFLTNNGNNIDPLDAAAAKSYNTTYQENPLTSIFSTAISLALSILGVTFLLLMIYGGFLWMSDQGNEQQVERAKNLIRAAIIGLVIVVSSYAISWLALSFFSKTISK